MHTLQYIKKTAHDAEEHACSLSGWEQHYEQLSSGRFEGSFEELRIGPVRVFREYANQMVLQGGQSCTGMVTLALTQTHTADGWYCGHPLENEQMIAISSDGEFSLVAGTGMKLTAVSVDMKHLAELVSGQPGHDSLQALSEPCLLQATAQTQTEFKQLLGSVFYRAQVQPSMLEQADVRQMLTLLLSQAVLDCVDASQIQIQLPSSGASRRRIVAKARNYMRDHAEEAITVPVLCQAIGASRRALQYAFEDVLHLSPVTYLRVMRLNRVRSELLSGSTATLGDIAARWGFWHMSRFAAEYRELFDELPSATRSKFLVNKGFERREAGMH
ncbi:MAG: helix-turn-helix domain-containing protein [Pseudomonadota bacterium]